jgi:hypothetical protein
MPFEAGPGDPVVLLEVDERKVAQPRFLVEWEQGPLPVVHGKDYPDPSFNPQEILPVGDGRDEYPANPVIAWHNWTYRDPSQSIKVQNGGQTNITPRAPLDGQRGRQQPPELYPNQATQSPTPWDDNIQIVPVASPDAEAARIAMANQYAAYSPAIVQ